MTSFLVGLRCSGPDWDPGLPAEKQSGWDAHAEFMDDLVEREFVLLGGPRADEERSRSR